MNVAPFEKAIVPFKAMVEVAGHAVCRRTVRKSKVRPRSLRISKIK